MASITTSTLARKYRPRTLADVVGQDNTIEQLEAAIKKKKFSSSYLFSGRTGCGKTTLALIIASYLGCSTGTACGKCPGCKAGRASPDFTHKDAATQGKVDDIRELMKLAQVSPMFGKRVIIIDECFPADTQVLMADGSYKDIIDVKKGDVVFSYNTQKAVIEPNVVEAFMDQGERELVRVWLDDGSYQDCTANHKWWSVTRNKMVRADELEEGEEFLPFDSVHSTTD